MHLTWKTVDSWREESGMTVAELARRAGIPERTIYAGLRKDARMNAATKSLMRNIFPEKFKAEEDSQ